MHFINILKLFHVIYFLGRCNNFVRENHDFLTLSMLLLNEEMLSDKYLIVNLLIYNMLKLYYYLCLTIL
jgi:hypothetical protein